MKPFINIQNCHRDSPEHRLELLKSETSVSAMESSLKTLIKLIKAQIDSSQEYSSKNLAWASELDNLAKRESDDPIVRIFYFSTVNCHILSYHLEKSLLKMTEAVLEVEKTRKVMMRQYQDIVVDPFDSFLKTHMASLKVFHFYKKQESRRSFERASDGVDSALDRYLGKRSKDPTIAESAEEVSSQRRQFHEKSINYALELNDFEFNKKADFYDSIVGMMHAQFTFFHQCYETLKDLKPCMNEISNRLNEMRKIHETLNNEALLQKDILIKDAIPLYNPTTSAGMLKPGANVFSKSGYLMKKGSGKITSVWSRRWFVVKGDYLMYSTRGKDEPPTLASNLRLCSVKPYYGDQIDRRFCFEVVSPMKSYILQAENEKEMMDWIQVLQAAIGNALNNDQDPEDAMKSLSVTKEKADDEFLSSETSPVNLRNATKTAVMETLINLRSVHGNSACADCGAPDPEWASLNLGVLICIECSGIHRSLGVQVSKIRSLTLDKLEPESAAIINSLGNSRVNGIFEEMYDPESASQTKPLPNSERSEKEKWITTKYVTRKFIKHVEEVMKDYVLKSYWIACETGDIINILQALMMGAPVDWRNPSCEMKTALMMAIERNLHVTIQFLLFWNADIKACDDKGWTPLHYAVSVSNEKLAQLLLKRNINVTATDINGQSALDLALDRTDPEMVTLLRMHLFEMEQNKPTKSAQGRDRMSSQPLQTEMRDEDGAAPIDKVSPIEQSTLAEDGGKKSPSKQRTSFSNSVSPTGSSSNTVKTSGISSPPKEDSSYTTQFASSASTLAGSAASYANRFIKSSFARLHADSAPTNSSNNNNNSNSLSQQKQQPQLLPSSASNEDIDETETPSESKARSFLSHFRPQYAAIDKNNKAAPDDD